VNAGLDFGRIEDELGFAAFLGDGLVAVDRYLAESLAIGRHAIPKARIVNCVSQDRRSQHRGETYDRQSLDEMLDSVSARCTHGEPL
jgi:hypothetical protein